MNLIIETPSFGPLQVMLARPLDFAIELTKIRFRGRSVLIGFHFKRAGDDWRLSEFICDPARGEISRKLENEIRRVGKREIVAWIGANTETIYRVQRAEIIRSLPEFRYGVRRVLGELKNVVMYPLREQYVWELFRPDGRKVLGCDVPRSGLETNLIAAAESLRKVLDLSRPETFAAA